MNAFHSNWTRPFVVSNPNKKYFIEDFEILTTILSAKEWRQHNGGISMITDYIGAEYYRCLGIEHIWDLGIDTYLEKEIPEVIDPQLFWAAGKIYALKSQCMPSAMLDTDFIVWETINKLVENSSISVIHTEDINCIYPNKDYFDMNNCYSFPKSWSWSVKPCNTAFLYMVDNEFKDYYTKCSIEFMCNLKGGIDPVIYMVFAEQRIISMCAHEKNVPINSLFDLVGGNMSEQTMFTHIWGHKRNLKKMPGARKDFCIKCIRRILKDFPEEEKTIANIKCLLPYYNLVRRNGI